MPYLTREAGVSLYFEQYGTGPVLLLTHGYSATSQMWQGQVQQLSRRYHVIVWDMRGHGRTSAPADPACFSEAATVGDMAALLDLAGADQAIIGGLSLGGYMSLAFHYRFPERVSALLIFDTGPGFRNPDARAAWNRTAEATAQELEQRGLDALKSGSAERASATHGSASGLAMAARGMLTQHDDRIIRSLPSIQVPTLVLAGADDEPFLAATDYMAAKIPDSARVLINCAGHAANLDQPAAFNAAVEGFLQVRAL